MDSIDEKTVENEWVLLSINNEFTVIPKQNQKKKVKELPLYIFGIKK